MMHRLVTFLCFFVAACATGPVERDNLGNVFPGQCTATVTPDVQVEYVAAATMIRLQRSFGYDHDLSGLHAVIGGRRFIWINVEFPDGTLRPPAQRRLTLRHELCHDVAGDWHP